MITDLKYLDTVVRQMINNSPNLACEPYNGPVYPFWLNRSVDGPPQGVWYDNFGPSDMVKPAGYGNLLPFFKSFTAKFQGWSLPTGTAIDTTNAVELPGSLRAVYPNASTSPFFIANSTESGKIIVLIPHGTIVTTLTNANILVNTTGYYQYFDVGVFGYVSNYLYYGKFQWPGFKNSVENTTLASYVNTYPTGSGTPVKLPLISWSYVQDGTSNASGIPIVMEGFANCFNTPQWGFQDDTAGAIEGQGMPMHCLGYRWRLFEPISVFTGYLTVGLIP